MKNSKNSTTSSKLPYTSELTYISDSKYLPPEVWTRILSTLPAKTLLKFRCVYKSWCSIIDNPDFAHMHAQFNSENNTSNRLLVALEGMGYTGGQGCVLTVRDAENLRKIDHIFRIHSYRYRLVGSCNGLLLVERSAPQGCLKEMRLWNPFIRKSLILPPCPLPSPLLYNSWYLFGFAPDSKDYKVVAFGFDNSRGIENENIYFAVYTLSNQQWTVRHDPLNVSSLNNNVSMFWMFNSVSSSLFFLSRRKDTVWLGNNDNQRLAFTHLGSFDFDQEKLTLLDLPFTCEERGSLRFLFLLGGSLAVFSISEVSSSIWVLEQDKQKGPWTLLFSGKSSEDGYEVFKLCYGNLEKVFYFENDDSYLVCGNKVYNIGSGQVQPFKRYMSSHLKLETYLETLVLFKGYGARDLSLLLFGLALFITGFLDNGYVFTLRSTKGASINPEAVRQTSAEFQEAPVSKDYKVVAIASEQGVIEQARKT
ncbi:F-box/kelch-repeat protein At3g06240-like [Silene latifolia]|uniref:F-box/kelch-repeat protein At3g06240-like n=1 Tax=Silene latifolia TaxID=37657 RepID=UPI003D77572B